MKNKLYEIIFESETKAGKAFDLLLIISILISVIIVSIDSIYYYHYNYGKFLYVAEWFFTILFSIEYLIRIYCSGNPIKYIKSFFGIIDLLSIIPTYVSFFIPSSRYLIVIRILRVLRIFRILKLILYIGEADLLIKAITASKRKVIVFLFSVFVMVTIFGSLMYIIEGENNGFSSIPRSIYWAIVTVTTVGYGDISPQTSLGQILASFIMIVGYATIAVPTGIISAEYTTITNKKSNNIRCNLCFESNNKEDFNYCKNCGEKLN